MNAVKLGDICNFYNGGAWSQNEFTEAGYPVLKVSNCKSNGFEISDVSYIPYDIAQKSKINKLQIDDVIIATVGSHPNLVESAAGRSCVVTTAVVGFYLNQNAVCLRSKDPNVFSQKYLGYLAASAPFKHYIQSRGKGAANQMRIAISAIKDFSFVLPDIEVQKAVGTILSAYDDLIENNQKQIKLLEEAVQRLYKEWFVDLRFPGHENVKIVDGVPEGWHYCVLDDVITFNPKVQLSKERIKQNVPMSALSISSMVLDTTEFGETISNSGSKFQNGDTLLARITPCLENGKTAFVSELYSAEGAVGSTEFIVMRSLGINPYMVYLLARTDDFRKNAINSMTGSDGRQRAQVDKLKALPYLKPADSVMELFGEYVGPMFAQIQVKNKQNIKLVEIRDRLLSKLMSGEIEV